VVPCAESWLNVTFTLVLRGLGPRRPHSPQQRVRLKAHPQQTIHFMIGLSTMHSSGICTFTETPLLGSEGTCSLSLGLLLTKQRVNAMKHLSPVTATTTTHANNPHRPQTAWRKPLTFSRVRRPWLLVCLSRRSGQHRLPTQANTTPFSEVTALHVVCT
jgi:hypothetical protein